MAGMSIEHVDRPTRDYEDTVKQMPPEEIRLKLINGLESQDKLYRFKEIRDSIQNDPDVAAWWLYWVYQTCFVWRFIFGLDENMDEHGYWLRNQFQAALGETLYAKKKRDVKEAIEASGDTIYANVC